MSTVERTHEELERTARARVRNKRVVTIGGGSGPFGMLSTLKHYPCSITAIVTMADSGGSSRRLMDEFGQLPVGDVRQALIALSHNGRLWRDVFTFRFQQGHGRAQGARLAGEPNDSKAQRVGQEAGVGGHSLGNLIISALQDINGGNLLRAIEDAQLLLDTAGNQVLPVTLSQTTLCAEMDDGEIICGETEIDTRGVRRPDERLSAIKRLFLRERTPPCEEALRAISRADVIVLGPGDLYTSILPNLLVDGIADAIRASGARVVYVCNLMTKRGETDGYRASDFVREIHAYLGGRVDRAILHDGYLPESLLSYYVAQGQRPVAPDVANISQFVPDVIVENVLSTRQDHLVRHDADRLVQLIFAPPAIGLAPLPALRDGERID